VAVLVFSLTATGWGRSRKKSTSEAAPSDPEYVAALATANRFLHAWQTGDLENGIVLVSDGVRHAQNAGELEQFFSTVADRAFEIRTGHGDHRRYSFPVVLVSLKETPVSSRSPAGKSASHRSSVRRASEIVLIDAGKNDWVVDKLP